MIREENLTSKENKKKVFGRVWMNAGTSVGIVSKTRESRVPKKHSSGTEMKYKMDDKRRGVDREREGTQGG